MRAFLDGVRQSFDWVSFPKFAFTDVIEILIIAFLIYHLINWIQRTRAWYLVKGLVVLMVCCDDLRVHRDPVDFP